MNAARALIVACAVLLTSHTVAAQREEVCLNGIWMIHNGGGADTIPADTWAAVRVPNKQSGWYLEESDIALGVMEGTTAWYRTGFEIPGDWGDGRRITLRFDGINHYAKVLVNGTSVGEHRFVYDAFELDITNVARPGEVNDLAVYVADVMAPGMALDFIDQLKWRAFVLRNGGLVDNVFLCSYPKIRVADVFVIPSFRRMELTAKVWITNDTAADEQVTVRPAVFLGSQRKLVMAAKKVAVPAGETVMVEFVKPWQDPILWGYGEYGSPTLYEFKTEIEASKTNDTRFDRFGFREFWCEGNEFRLNGRKIFLTSDCAGMSRAFSYSKNRHYANMLMQAMREMNCNQLRLGWAPRRRLWFDVADEAGMLLEVNVNNSVPVFGYDEPINRPNEACVDCVTGEKATRVARLIRRYVRQHRNHPSIVIWASNNEVACQAEWGADPRGLQGLANIQRICNEEDPTRPVQHQGSPRVTHAKQQGVDFEPDMWNVHPYGKPLINDVKRLAQLYNFQDDRPAVVGETYFGTVNWGMPGRTPEQRKAAYAVDKATGEFWAAGALDFFAFGGDGIQMLELQSQALNGAISETEFEAGPWGVGVVEPRDGQKRPGITRADLAIRAEGPNIIAADVTWPADSGEDIKVPGLGWGAAVAYSNVNWWDPQRKAYGINIAGRQVADAYATISGGNLPPLAPTRRPELIVTVMRGDQPVPDRYVRVSPASGQAAAPRMVRTDLHGRAWFVLPLPGRYEVSFANLASTTIQLDWAKRDKQPGWAFIKHCKLTLPENAPPELTVPLNSPDTDRHRFLELVQQANPNPRAHPHIPSQKIGDQPAQEPVLMPTRTTRLVYQIHRVNKAVRIDARGDEWTDVPAIELGKADQLTRPQTTRKNWRGPDDLSATVQVALDKQNIYLRAVVRDDHPLVATPGSPPHEGDSVELYLGLAGPSDRPSYTAGTDFQIVLSAGGAGVEPSVHLASPVATAPSPWAIKVRKVDAAAAGFAGYELEARIALAALGSGQLEPGQALGFDVAVNDADDPAALRKCKLDWACDTKDSAWQSPAVWNEAVVTP